MNGDPPTRWAWADIDLDAVRHNVEQLRATVAPSGLWAVVKANGYGHGAVDVARAALAGGADGLCVALAQEGLDLRDRGITAPILLLSEQPPAAETLDNFAATMEVLGDLVKEGKIRAFGLSNETAWGTLRWLEAAAATGGPRVAAIQNEYSLMCRHYDTDMAEVGYQEDVTLLAFSPLAVGLLTGKYTDGAVPDGSRLSLNETLGGRARAQSFVAADAYVQAARDHGVDPVHMALAWCVERPFPNIPIFGATTSAQLDHIIAGLDVTLSDELKTALSNTHRNHPMPY